MKQYEYKEVRLSGYSCDGLPYLRLEAISKLNELGKDGWKAVRFIESQKSFDVNVLMMREINAEEKSLSSSNRLFNKE